MSASTTSAGEAPVGCVLVFEAGPCDPAAMGRIVEHARLCSPYVSPELVRDLDALSTDPDTLHRQLLALARRLGKSHRVRGVIDDALDLTRRHSNLYTKRSCECRSHAWAAFADTATTQVSTRLKGGRWGVTAETGAMAPIDAFGPNHVADLTAYVCAYRHSPTAGPPDQLTLHIVTAEHVELSAQFGQQTRTATLRRLPDELMPLAVNLSTPGPDWRSSLAGRVLRWPEQTLAIVTGWATGPQPKDGWDLPDGWVTRLLDANPETLTRDEARIAAVLARNWTEGPVELLETARRVAAGPVTSDRHTPLTQVPLL